MAALPKSAPCVTVLLRQKANVALLTMVFVGVELLESDPPLPPLPITSVPPPMVVPPVYEFEPVNVRMPLPVWLMP